MRGVRGDLPSAYGAGGSGAWALQRARTDRAALLQATGWAATWAAMSCFSRRCRRTWVLLRCPCCSRLPQRNAVPRPRKPCWHAPVPRLPSPWCSRPRVAHACTCSRAPAPLRRLHRSHSQPAVQRPAAARRPRRPRLRELHAGSACPRGCAHPPVALRQTPAAASKWEGQLNVCACVAPAQRGGGGGKQNPKSTELSRWLERVYGASLTSGTSSLPVRWPSRGCAAQSCAQARTSRKTSGTRLQKY